MRNGKGERTNVHVINDRVETLGSRLHLFAESCVLQLDRTLTMSAESVYSKNEKYLQAVTEVVVAPVTSQL